MLILAKIVQHSKKCQTIDLIFFYFCPSMRILCKILYNHMLYIFTPFIFTRIQQIIKVKQKDHISSMSSVGLVYFLARECQHKTKKLESHFQHLPNSSYTFYKIETNLKALIQLNLIPSENTQNSRFHSFIKQYTS